MLPFTKQSKDRHRYKIKRVVNWDGHSPIDQHQQGQAPLKNSVYSGCQLEGACPSESWLTEWADGLVGDLVIGEISEIEWESVGISCDALE